MADWKEIGAMTDKQNSLVKDIMRTVCNTCHCQKECYNEGDCLFTDSIRNTLIDWHKKNNW